MKIRITGTMDELEVAKCYYKSLESKPFVKSVEISNLYANRGSSTIYRLYIDIQYKSEQEAIQCISY